MAKSKKTSVAKSKNSTVKNPIQLQKFLGGVDYPAKKSDLIKVARNHGADKRVLDTLESMPQNDFNSPNDISEAFGKMH